MIMRFGSVFAVAVILFIYIGNVLGNAVLCETVPELARAKKFIWVIPFVQVFYPIRLIVSAQNNRFVLLYRYIRIPHKNIIMSYAFAQVSRDMAARKKQNAEWNIKAKGKQFFWENSMINYSQTIMRMPQY